MSLSKEEIKNQIEFYFSDSNYRIDTFLKTTCALDDGYIPISTICKFKNLSTNKVDEEQVKEACKDSKVVEIKDNKIKKIITPEYQEYLKINPEENIVGIRGFDKKMTIKDIQLFLQDYATPKLIRLKRDKKRNFNGDVLVELASKEEVEKMLGMKIKLDSNENEPKKLKTEENFLQIMTKNELLNLKREEKKETKKEKDNFTNKVYTFACDVPLQIKDIKKAFDDVAFVDIKSKCLRFKNTKDFEEKEIVYEDKTIQVKKMDEEGVKKYLNEINSFKKSKAKKN